jgi:hypothetical protein
VHLHVPHLDSDTRGLLGDVARVGLYVLLAVAVFVLLIWAGQVSP